MPDAAILAATEQRYRQRAPADTGLRVGQRAARAIIDTTAPLTSVDFSTLERIIGANDMVPARFLTIGLAAARPVGRIGVRAAIGPTAGWGTGSLVSPSLVLTNNHVLANRTDAAASTVEFDYELLPSGDPRPTHTFALQPQRFFLTSAKLDFTLVAVAATSDDGTRLGTYGWNPMTADPDKVMRGEKLNIVQHPEGRMKTLALRENELITILDDFLHYRTDTNPGSSGSPVFNDEWELVALHHSGVPRRNDDGQLLNTDGTLWSPLQGEDAIAWEANEGVRISRIVATLRAAKLKDEADRLRDEALGAHPPQIDDPSEAATDVVTTGAGTSIHVHIHVHEAPTVSVSPPEPSLMPTAGELADALAELGRAPEKRYYDTGTDKEATADYYSAVGRRPNVDALRALVTDTHSTQPRYKPALELYPWIDLRPDLTLASIYSGQGFDPAKAIVEDFRLQAEHHDPLLEAELPYNCEHVVPQSWFEHHEPMRGDLHHLFACESRCNSFRGNLPYHDFDPIEEATRDACGRLDNDLFEPDQGKGACARATLYMWLRYPDAVDWLVAGDVDRWLQTLVRWHEAYPVDAYERHRNLAIHQRQGNRNPFVDRPNWAAVLAR